MRRWALMLAILTLMASYWSYSIDLECQVRPPEHCEAEHADQSLGCAAPSLQIVAHADIVCPTTVQLVVVAGLSPRPPQVGLQEEPVHRPPRRHDIAPGPPRAPPQAPPYSHG